MDTTDRLYELEVESGIAEDRIRSRLDAFDHPSLDMSELTINEAFGDISAKVIYEITRPLTDDMLSDLIDVFTTIVIRPPDSVDPDNAVLVATLDYDDLLNEYVQGDG